MLIYSCSIVQLVLDMKHCKYLVMTKLTLYSATLPFLCFPHFSSAPTTLYRSLHRLSTGSAIDASSYDTHNTQRYTNTHNTPTLTSQRIHYNTATLHCNTVYTACSASPASSATRLLDRSRDTHGLTHGLKYTSQ